MGECLKKSHAHGGRGSHKKATVPFVTTWTGLEGFIRSEVKSEKDEYRMTSLQNKRAQNEFTDAKNRLAVARSGRRGGGGGQGVGWMGKRSQKVQMSIYKINESRGVMYSMVTLGDNTDRRTGSC